MCLILVVFSKFKLFSSPLKSSLAKEEDKVIIPYDTLKNDELHHEALSELAVHGVEQRDAHDESVRQSGD